MRAADWDAHGHVRDRAYDDVVLHVVDAKNLSRMLPFTLQLIEAGLPLMLEVNLMDEADQLGMKVDAGELSRQLDMVAADANTETFVRIAGRKREKIYH